VDEFTPEVPVHDADLLAAALAIEGACLAVLARPNVAASGVGAGHWTATLANTLYTAVLTGPQGDHWVRAIRSIVLSLSAAALVVVGNNRLVPGGIADGELVRWRAAAPGTYTFDFGPEGILPGAMGSSGQSLFWTDTAGLVVDIMVVYN
jgi:hypothetical protein